MYFTHSALILTQRNLPPTVNKQWPPSRESRMSRHSLQHQPKNGNCRKARYISWYKYSLQADTTIYPNPILYFYCVENVGILVIWNAIREFVTEKLIQLWWNTAMHARRLFCFLSSHDVVWLISTQNPTCHLTVLLHNYYTPRKTKF